MNTQTEKYQFFLGIYPDFDYFSIWKLNEGSLANLYIRTGAKNMPTVFLLTDAQVLDESFLVLINDLLASGD